MRSIQTLGFPGDSDGKGSACNAGRPEFDHWVRKIPWKREWHPTPLFLPGEFHGQRRLAVYSPWDCKESDTTEWLICIHTQVQTLRLNLPFAWDTLITFFISHLAVLDLFTTVPSLVPGYASISSQPRVIDNSTEEWMVGIGSQFTNQHNRKL